MTFQVPEQLALHHGGKDLLPGALKFAETFEVWGGMRAGMRVLDAVGHTLESVKALHEEAGMRVTGVFAGAWTGRENVTDNKVRHSQDVIVTEII